MNSIKTFLVFFCIILSNSLTAQSVDTVKKGEVLEIGAPETYQYAFVKFPRSNFIIKKRGVSNFKNIPGTLVKVTEVRENSKGDTIVILRRKDGKKFFGSFPEIKADYKKAIASAELVK